MRRTALGAAEPDEPVRPASVVGGISITVGQVERVLVNGFDISSAVSAVALGYRVGSQPRIELELIHHVAEVTALGDVDRHYLVDIPERTRVALVALGWKPPVGDPRFITMPRDPGEDA